MNVSYEEIGQSYATVAAQGVSAGQVCKAAGNGGVMTGFGRELLVGSVNEAARAAIMEL